MNPLLKIIIIWISIDTVVISTGWYLATLRHIWPGWWRRVMVEKVDPRFNLK